MTTSIILHIGPHKTGSTYLQKLMDNCNNDEFKDVNFVNFGIELFGHHKFVNSLRGWNQLDPNSINKFIKPNKINIISSENFVFLNHNEVVKLKNSLSHFPIKIIYYYRDYINSWTSHWQELVKHGRDESFYEYLLSVLDFFPTDLGFNIYKFNEHEKVISLYKKILEKKILFSLMTILIIMMIYFHIL